MRVQDVVLAAAVVTGSCLTVSGCGTLGPSCLARQKTGPVTSLTGQIEARQVVTSVVPYDQRGSQNDVRIDWSGQGSSGGPRVYLYATSSGCTEFTPPPLDGQSDAGTGACRIISRCGGFLAPDARPCGRAGTCPPLAEDIVCTSLIVTGPGNGAPPGFSEYKLHVVGDLQQSAAYSISITWFSGRDC